MLSSWREPGDIMTTPDGAMSMYKAFNCCWLFSTKCASWAEGSTEQRHVFATQYNDYEYPVRIVLDENCVETVYRLGLPTPEDRITAVGAETRDKNSAARQYMFQFIDSFGNPSGTSEPSEPLIVSDGASVLLSGWSIPAGGWDIQKIRILRSVSGFESPTKESENKIDAAWMLVDEIAATTTSYTDSKFDADLYEAMGTDVIEPPPAGLQGLTWIRSINALAGFVGKEIYFTENNHYHNWEHKLLLDDTVCGIVESNDVIYAATDGAPYAIEGSATCENAGCRKAIRMPQSLPMVGCSGRNMAAIPSGAVYPTHAGLVLMQGKQAPRLLTSSHYADEDWQAMHPATARIAYHDARLYVFMRKGAFCMAIKDGAGTAADLEHHTELSLRPDEVFVSRGDRFYMRFGDQIKEWNRGVNKLEHTYEAAHTITGTPFAFGAVQVIMHPGVERFTVKCDEFVVLDETIYTSDKFVLPMWAVGQTWYWLLQGTADVKLVGLAPSFKEL